MGNWPKPQAKLEERERDIKEGIKHNGACCCWEIVSDSVDYFPITTCPSVYLLIYSNLSQLQCQTNLVPKAAIEKNWSPTSLFLFSLDVKIKKKPPLHVAK